MKPLTILLAAISVPAIASSQQTVVETRVFHQEVFAGLDANDFDIDVGPLGPTEAQDGMVVIVEIDLLVDWLFEIEVTNLASFADTFRYETAICLTSENCNCNPYQCSGFGTISSPVAPGDTAQIGGSTSIPFQFAATDFDIGGGSGAWSWPDVHLLGGASTASSGLTFGEGVPVPKSWITVLSAQATVTGTVLVEWVPNPLPAQVVCPGNSVSAATLAAAGDYDNFWLLQAGVPASFNLLLTSDAASSMVPANGVCLDMASPAFMRYTDSLTVGGLPYRIPDDPAFAGTTQYFQSWFRAPSGAQTSECIGVTFP